MTNYVHAGILDGLKSTYESLSTAEIVIVLIVLFFVIFSVTIYITFRIIRAKIEKRVKLGTKVAKFTAKKLSEKLGAGETTGSEESIAQGVLSDTSLESAPGEEKLREEADLTAQDVSELFDELSEESFLFSIIGFFYKRFFLARIKKEENDKE